MSIKLTWTNPNTSFDSVKIYRSVEPFNFAAMPTPIGTVTSGNTFEDTTALRNVTYHYVISVVKGTDELMSPVKIIANMPYTGPGPQRLLRGNWKRGYFGELGVNEMFTATELSNTVGFTSGTLYATADQAPWHKFVHDGKILFIPAVGFRYGLTWNSIYAAGIAYGTGDNGPAQAATTPVLQNKQVSRDGHVFKVRLPRANRTPDYSLTTTVATIDHDSEWSALVVPTVYDNLGVNFHRKWSDLMSSYVSANGVNYRVAFPECTTTTFNTIENFNNLNTAVTSTRTTGSTSWHPVLELVI